MDTWQTHLSIDEYKQTVHEGALKSARKLAADAASRLRTARVPMDTVLVKRVVQRPVAIPRKILGVRVGDRREMHPHTEPVLQGWKLRNYGQTMGDDGSEWYQWTDICVVAEDGVLYKGQHRREEHRHGRYTRVTDEISASPIATTNDVFSLERNATDGSPYTPGAFCESIADSIETLLTRMSSPR